MTVHSYDNEKDIPKPFPCLNCNKSFALAESLKKHQVVHTPVYAAMVNKYIYSLFVTNSTNSYIVVVM